MIKINNPSDARRSQAKHESIIRAAADVADKAGYENSTIEGVAAQAGVGKQTIYRWWPSKALLYIETYRHLVASDDKAVAGATCHEHLHRFLCRLFRRYKTTAAGKILVGLIAESTHNEQAAMAIEQGLFLDRSHLLVGPIMEGVSTGELNPNLDAEWAAEVIVALIWKRLMTSPEKLNPKFSQSLLKTALGPSN